MTESDQSVIVSDRLELEKIRRIAIFLLFNLSPYGLAAALYLMAPGGAVPFFNYPMAKFILLTPVFLQTIVVIFFVGRELSRKDPTVKTTDWPYWLFASIIGFMGFMAPILVPALVTVLSALEPMSK